MHYVTDVGRVGIVTIMDRDNFGNRLQNFALQESLRGLGWDATTIRNRPHPMRRSLVVRRALIAMRKDGFRRVADRNAHRLLARRSGENTPVGSSVNAEKRRQGIADFNQAFVDQSAEDYGELPDPRLLAHEYEYFVVGSDQVWNPGFRGANDIDFLRFARREQRVAYAASFGVPEVPAYLTRVYRRNLSEIPSISVREEGGVGIVRDLTSRVVPLVLDPTMLLEQSRWYDMAATSAPVLGEPYLVKFILGESPPHETAAIDAFAKARELRVVDLNALDQDSYCTSPRDFVGAIKGASLVATNSFHAAVFSIIFERATITKSRHSDDSRLDDLFARAGIRRKPCGHGFYLSSGTDWECVRTELARDRERSRDFLATALAPH